MSDLFGDTEPQSSAIISACGLYRYYLARAWDPGLRSACWICLNPSTADASSDDPTSRRCMSFARAWGCGGGEIVNLFALRSPDPKVLRQTEDPVGPRADHYILLSALRCQFVVVAWGVHGAYQGRDRAVLKMLQGAGVELWCLGVTKGGQPKHPLYVPGYQQLLWFPEPA